MTETIVAGFVLAPVLIGSGLLLRRIAARAATGELGVNPVAGIRTSATVASPEAWRAAHARAEGPSTLAGTVATAAGVATLAVTVLMLVGVAGDAVGGALLLAVVSVGMVGMLALGTYGCIAGHRAAKEIADTTVEA